MLSHSPPVEGCPKGGVVVEWGIAVIFIVVGNTYHHPVIPLPWRGARRAGYSPPLEGCPKGGVVVEWGIAVIFIVVGSGHWVGYGDGFCHCGY